jgi:ankyrin repeat protein
MKRIYSFIILFNLICVMSTINASQIAAAKADGKYAVANSQHKTAENASQDTIQKLTQAITKENLSAVIDLVPLVPKESLNAASKQARECCTADPKSMFKQTILRIILNRLFEKPTEAASATAAQPSAAPTSDVVQKNEAKALALRIAQLQNRAKLQKEPLYFKGCLYTRTQIVTLIRDNEFDLSQPIDAKKRTILMRAAMKNDIELMQLVTFKIKDSKYFKLRDVDGENVFTLATKVSDLETLETLLKRRTSAQQTTDGTTAINILPVADINEPNQDGDTPLHIAVKNDRPKEVALLLEFGADVDAKNDDGSTALLLSVHTNNPVITALLIKAKANPLLDVDGIPALQLAETAMENSNFDGDQAQAESAAENNERIITLLEDYTHKYAKKAIGTLPAMRLLSKIKRASSNGAIACSARRAAWKKQRSEQRAQEVANDQKSA